MYNKTVVLLASAMLALAAQGANDAATQPANVAYDTKVVPAFEAASGTGDSGVARGQSQVCTTDPAQGVKYPKALSEKPLYGSLTCRPTPDASQCAVFAFFLDESAGTGKGYDRLYFDFKGNGDLTNVQPVGLRKGPAPENVNWGGEAVYFEPVKVEFDIGEGLGKVAEDLSTRLVSYGGGRWVLSFIADVRHAEIRLGRRGYTALLAQTDTITGRFDGTGTGLFLKEAGARGDIARWWGADSINQMRCEDGTWYSFSATAKGDKLIVHTYRGELGVLVVGPGGRDVNRLGRPPDRKGQGTDTAPVASSAPARPVITFQGSVKSKDTQLAVGTFAGGSGWPEGVERMTLPEGDYTANLLGVQIGRLSIELSHNYHADGKPFGSDHIVYGMKVRKDKPFILDFSDKPEVIWPSPAKGAIVRPGETVRIMAVLIDPKLDVMIRQLDDTSQKVKKTVTFGDRESQIIERNKSLDPMITIADSSGKQVASGVMPFG
jgi:hypothetical protein